MTRCDVASIVNGSQRSVMDLWKFSRHGDSELVFISVDDVLWLVDGPERFYSRTFRRIQNRLVANITSSSFSRISAKRFMNTDGGSLSAIKILAKSDCCSSNAV